MPIVLRLALASENRYDVLAHRSLVGSVAFLHSSNSPRLLMAAGAFVGDCILTRQIDFLRKNSYFQCMGSPLGRRFDVVSPRSETPGTVGSFLSTVWYRV